MYSSYSPCKEVTDALQQQLISHFLRTQSRKTKNIRKQFINLLQPHCLLHDSS